MKKETLESFVKYCEENPEQRFWQALRNWADGYYREKTTIRSIEIERADSDGECTYEDTWELE